MAQLLAKDGALTGLTRVRMVCLYGVIAVAAELHVIVIDALGINPPDAGAIAPLLVTAWGPWMLATLWLNLAVNSPTGHLVLDLGASHVWGALLLSSLIFLEYGHAIAGNRAPDFQLILSLVWIALLYLTLVSFSSVPGVVDRVVAAIVVCSVLGLVVIVATAIANTSVVGLVQLLQSPNRLEISSVNSFSYLAAVASLLCLQRLLWRSLPASHNWLWATGFVANAVAVIALKSRGAWLLLLTLGLLFLLSKYVRSKLVVALAGTTILVVVAALATGQLSLHLLDNFLSLGRGLNPSVELEARGLRLEQMSRVSVPLRQDMVLTTIDVVRDNPLIGVGLADFVLRRSEGHSVHGIPFLMAGAYGLVGVVLTVGFFLSNIGRSPDATRMPIAAIAIASLGAASLLLGDAPYWFALCLGLLYLSTRPPKTCLEF